MDRGSNGKLREQSQVIPVSFQSNGLKLPLLGWSCWCSEPVRQPNGAALTSAASPIPQSWVSRDPPHPSLSLPVRVADRGLDLWVTLEQPDYTLGVDLAFMKYPNCAVGGIQGFIAQGLRK